MEPQKRECIEYALHAYDTFWSYYKKTLDERNQILNNYMVFVGVPISVTGLLIEKISHNISYYSSWFILAFTIILVLGIVIYESYITESFISERYLKQIKCITNHLVQNYDNLYKNVFKELYTLDALFLDSGASHKHRFRKSFIIVTINTGIIIGIFGLIFLKNIKWYYILFAIIISFFVHIMIFICCKQSYYND